MQITNLDFNNYYTGNDRWITVSNFLAPATKLELKVKNLGTLNEVNLIIYAYNNIFKFNLAIAVRSVMNDVILQNQNVINNIELTFKVGAETNVLNKTFIKGFARQTNSTKDYVDNGELLYIGELIQWDENVSFYLNAFLIFQNYQILNNNAISGEHLPLFQPIPPFRNKDYCNYAVVRFLNSKGGYQSFIFDSFEIQTKNKPEKLIPKSIYQFNDAGFKTIGSEVNSEIELYSNSNRNENDILADMITSNDVAWFNFDTETWIQLIPNANTINTNQKDNVFKNKLKFDLYTTVNNSDLW